MEFSRIRPFAVLINIPDFSDWLNFGQHKRIQAEFPEVADFISSEAGTIPSGVHFGAVWVKYLWRILLYFGSFFGLVSGKFRRGGEKLPSAFDPYSPFRPGTKDLVRPIP